LPESDPQRLELAKNVVRIPWQALRPPPLHSVGSLSVAVPIVKAAGLNDKFAEQFSISSDQLKTVNAKPQQGEEHG
jgi:hypothetical protein